MSQFNDVWLTGIWETVNEQNVHIIKNSTVLYFKIHGSVRYNSLPNLVSFGSYRSQTEQLAVAAAEILNKHLSK